MVFGKGSPRIMTVGKKAARSVVPKRRPDTGGYARGVEQRARIIVVALKVFGEEGYERATTRRIAQAAGIQPPALQYYFGSKEGLHRACAEFVVEKSLAVISGPLSAARAVAPDCTPETALDVLCVLIDALFDGSLFKRDAPERAVFSARAQTETTPGGTWIREQISDPLHDTCARLVARVTDSPCDDIARLRTSLIIGQLSNFRQYRDVALARLGWDDFDESRRATVKAWLRMHTRAALGFPT